jgi:hypothetical protein
MTTPTWPPQPQQTPPSPSPSFTEPPPGERHSRRFTKKLHIIGAAVGGLVLGIGIGAGAASTTTTAPVAAPPMTRTVTVTATPTGSVPSATVSLPSATSAAAPASAEAVTPTPVPLRTLTPGTYEVGTGVGQAAPGKYKSNGPDSSNFVGCYYARLKNNDGGLGDIINNNISQGPSVFTIKPSDGYVEISGCTFTKS